MNSDSYIEKKEGNRELSAVSFLAPGMETRLSAALDRIGTRKKAAEVVRVSTDALQRWIRGENMPAFDAVVAICASAGVRLEWLAFDAGPMLVDAPQTAPESQSQAAGIDTATLEGAVAAVRAVESALGVVLSAKAVARVVALAYQHARAGETAAQLVAAITDAVRGSLNE